ncbi:MAG TPA: ethanolamine utilization protein [Planctomycetaceae bacterium]|nr:ethanolamine utilization protein [Planctomycetaceae bacterium]
MRDARVRVLYAILTVSQCRTLPLERDTLTDVGQNMANVKIHHYRILTAMETAAILSHADAPPEVEFSEDVFVDFGPDPYFPFQRTGLERVDGDTKEALRDGVKRFAPRAPGVYGMIDALGRLVYVGKSKLLRNRLLSYFLPNNEEDKAGRIAATSSAIVWEAQPSEFAALLREQYLIRHFQPRFNVQGLPKRQQPIFLCLGRPPAEQLYTTRQPDANATLQIGPLFGATRAARSLEVLNRIFKLRDCGTKQKCSFTDQLQLFDIELRPGCIRLEIESCLGPCISACSKDAYRQAVSQAKDFLLGLNASPIEILEDQMAKAADRQHFEQAAVLREDVKAVKWLSRRAVELKKARDRYTFVYQVKGTDCGRRPGQPSDKFDIWYLIRRGTLEGAVAAPSTESEKRSLRRRLSRWLDAELACAGDIAPRPETLALISSWFRNHRS